MVIIAAEDTLTPVNIIPDRHIFTFLARKDLGHRERLCHKIIQLFSALIDQLVGLAELVNTNDRNNAL